MKSDSAEMSLSTGSDSKTKILFVAPAQSTHTHSWVDLMTDSNFDARVFGIRGTIAPAGFPFQVISTGNRHTSNWLSSYLRWRIAITSRALLNDKLQFKFLNFMARIFGQSAEWFGECEEELLANAILTWKPDIIHTLGIEFSALLFKRTRKCHNLEHLGVWVISAWGGSDFDLACHDPLYATRLSSVLQECDYFIADNDPAYLHAKELGLDSSKNIHRGKTPGAGGVYVDRLRSLRSTPPSKQRTILIPKAYECPFSKILPVFEAVKLCWEQISPCKLVMTACNEEAKAWFRTLPENIRFCSVLEERIPNEQLFEIMASSRVVLAPSLIDGIPNTLYESMATGAFPIFSPLETFRDLLKGGENILYARNLYPEEIAGALVKAMNDDILVDSAAELNLPLVRSLADRSAIKRDVASFYNTIANRKI